MSIEITPIIDEGLGNTTWLVGLGDGGALVIDPRRDPVPHLEVAERRGLRITYSAETHLHADFVSGSQELAARGARVIASAAGSVEFPHRSLADCDEVDLGGLTLRALATPGHTPEHLAYLLLDQGRPVALFSGGSLLVGAVARTDLIGPERTEKLAGALWRSLHDRILTLPDDLAVYPTHGAGSFCSAPGGAQRSTTIGREKASNPLLAAPSVDAFVKMALGELGSYPPYFLRLREVNRRGPTVYGPQPPPLPGLKVSEVRDLVRAGADIVDVRPVSAFGAAHVAGSFSIPLREQFATWLGWLVDADRRLIFVLDDDQHPDEVVRQALKIGHERLAGRLTGGVSSWAAAGLPLRHIRIVAVEDVDGPVLDVRQDAEFGTGHVPGARHIELGALHQSPPGPGPFTLMCGHGERAMTAASLLAAAGHDDLTVAVGGPGEWAAARARSLEVGS